MASGLCECETEALPKKDAVAEVVSEGDKVTVEKPDAVEHAVRLLRVDDEGDSVGDADAHTEAEMVSERLGERLTHPDAEKLEVSDGLTVTEAVSEPPSRLADTVTDAVWQRVGETVGVIDTVVQAVSVGKTVPWATRARRASPRRSSSRSRWALRCR